MSQRNALPVFETRLFDDSDNDERFYGFCAEDIVLREAVADSDFDINPYLTGKTSESSTVGPREPWLDLGSRPGRFGEL